MERGGLRRRVRGRVRPTDERVLRADEDDRAAVAPARSARGTPLGPAESIRARARRSSCSQSASVVSTTGALLAMPAEQTRMSRPPKPSTVRRNHRLDGFLARDIDLNGKRTAVSEKRANLRSHLLRACAVEIGDDDVRAELGEHPSGRAADPARAAGDESDTARQLPRRWKLRELVALEGPVLDGKGLRLAQRPKPACRLGRVLHRDRAVIELACSLRLHRVRARRDHPDAGNEHDPWSGWILSDTVGSRPTTLRS